MTDSGNSEKDLNEKVLSWLHTEGFPLEFSTANIFLENGFAVKQSFYVRDVSSGSPREVDVLADFNVDMGDCFIRIRHVIECKWSKDKPWIVFTSPQHSIAPAACIAQTICSEVGHAILWARAGDKKLQSLDMFQVPRRPGFAGRQAFTKGTDPFYSALQSVTSATFSLAKASDRADSDFSTAIKFAMILLPVIVVEGNLYEAYFDRNTHQVRINEMDRIRVHWRGAEAWSFFATIDLVRSDKL